MRVMCLNGWGGKLADALIPYLAAERPDVLCPQEVVETPGAVKPWLEYRDGAHVLDQRANLFAEVAAALPDHVAVFCPAAEGVLWDGAEPVASRWGLATFVHRSLPVIGQVQGFVHKEYSAEGYGAHPRSRCAHGVRVWVRALGMAVSVLHMHGLRDLAGKGDTPERRAQAGRLAAMAEVLARPGEPLVVCGDFNVGPESETFGVLGALGLADLVTAGGWAGTRTAEYAKPGKFADYMLVNDAVPLGSFEVAAAPVVSDHCPLVLEIGPVSSSSGAG